MNPELIAKLKSAGFPLPKIYSIETVEKEGCPSLSQLISACGEYFYILRWLRHQDKWEAISYNQVDSELVENADKIEFGVWLDAGISSGSTPEEAVANLYLALNKKLE